MDDNIPALAAALAYYAFLAIPSALLLAAGTFSLVAGPDAVNSIVTTLGQGDAGPGGRPGQQSLTNLTKSQAHRDHVLGRRRPAGGLGLGGAMQNVMWALNIAYERKETRGFVRRRLAALGDAPLRARRLRARRSGCSFSARIWRPGSGTRARSRAW